MNDRADLERQNDGIDRSRARHWIRSAPIGREVELEELARAVAKNRLVSVTGEPGVGKSALAAAFVETHPSLHCSLLGVRDPDGVCRELSRVLGLPNVATPTTAGSASRIGRAIAAKGKIAVVLDDADLARSALTKLVPSWMTDARSARFVVVARARIGVAGAQRFEVGPLDVPKRSERDRAAIIASPAVRLFVRCATAVRPEYRLSDETSVYVASIVRALAGNPLAIELCASRVVVLGEREMADVLAERLDALDTGSAAAGGRTLRGAFALSWDQLEDDAARVLAACAAFRGSFELDAATAVTAEPRLPVTSSLARLEEASLVRVFEPEAAPGTRRYVLPASVRVFAWDHLPASAREDLSRRHAEYYGAAAGRGDGSTNDGLALDREDLEAALTWATQGGRSAMAARVAIALAPLALACGPLVPFLKRIDALLGESRLPRALAAELYLVRALGRIHHGRRDAALADLELARKLARTVKDKRVEVLATSKYGLVVGLKGDFRKARALFESAAERLGDDGAPRLRGVVSKDFANVLSEEGQNAEAMIVLAQARDLFHRAGDVREEGFVLMMLASRLLDDGQVEDARRDLGAGMELLKAARDERSMGWCQVLFSLVDTEQGDLGSARTRLEGALATFRSIGDAHTEGLVLGYLGNVALEQGAFTEAEGLYRDARVLLAEVGDAGSEAFVTATAAVCDVALGRKASARARFARARSRAEGDGRTPRREALAILESLLAKPSSSAAVSSVASNAEEVRFAKRVVALVRARLQPARPDDVAARLRGGALVVAPDGSWLRTPSSALARFGARGALRGIVRRLAQDRVRYPGRPITPQALVRAGWPGETILETAAKNRLHVTIARLRKAGLGELLVHGDDGYFLDPSIDARIAEASERASSSR